MMNDAKRLDELLKMHRDDCVHVCPELFQIARRQEAEIKRLREGIEALNLDKGAFTTRRFAAIVEALRALLKPEGKIN